MAFGRYFFLYVNDVRSHYWQSKVTLLAEHLECTPTVILRFCLFAQIVLIRLFEECERNGVKTRASFFELERVDDFVLAQMLEECLDKFAHSLFGFVVDVF